MGMNRVATLIADGALKGSMPPLPPEKIEENSNLTKKGMILAYIVVALIVFGSVFLMIQAGN